MNIHLHRLIGTIMLFLDLVFLNLAVIICILYIKTFEPVFQVEYDRFWILLNVFWILVSWVLNIYSEKTILNFEDFCRFTMHAFFYWVILDLFYLFFAHQYVLSRYFIAVAFGLFGLFLFLNRC